MIGLCYILGHKPLIKPDIKFGKGVYSKHYETTKGTLFPFGTLALLHLYTFGSPVYE